MEFPPTHSYDPRLADSESQTPAAGDYAFLNHSAATLPHSLPPDVDDKPLARQKRKRTSPEDQIVLEAAYKRDPKPDKAARLELVEQVTLGEKEVQIWFQNRRQSSRRKSRPLLPHEIAQYQLARSSQTPQLHNSDSTIGDELEDEGQDETEEEQGQIQPEPMGTVPAPVTTSDPYIAPEATMTRATPSIQHAPTFPVDTARAHSVIPGHQPPAAAMMPVPAPADAHAYHLGYFANRRSAEMFRLSQTGPEVYPISAPAASPAGADSGRRLKKSSSIVRLSMSFDGNASVVTKDGSSPSPPRAPQVMLLAATAATIAPPQFTGQDQAYHVAPRSNLQRSSSGRSRDSRAWEFWCDKDARTELEEKAEKDSSGSAADAIGLLRSASGRSILGSNPAKRNSLISRHPSEVKRSKLNHDRALLQRSNTSTGRLQGRPSGGATSPRKPRQKLKYSESTVSVHVPGNDSDKENWSPDTDRPPSSHPFSQTMPATQPHSGRAVLGENRTAGNVPAQRANSRGTTKSRPDSENADPEADAEVAAFMRSERKSNSTSSEDDLDCVQGLLSLSQGNWR